MQLAAWGEAIDNALDQGKADQATALAKLLLRKHARHLPTYERIIQICLTTRRWAEAREWGLRLLRGDPTNALGWVAVAIALEKRGESAPSRVLADQEVAHSAWGRAVDLDPYNPEIRAGWQRTVSDKSALDGPELSQCTLAFLHLRAGRWQRALALFNALAKSDEAEPAYQVGRLLALWRTDEQGLARFLAQSLTDANRGLLIGWLVRAAVGDENDRALAQGYVESLDPDGDYATRWLGSAPRQEGYTVRLNQAEQKMLDEILKG